jgi:hypothetical protein
MTKTAYPRGLCCHEAGHAVVAWSFDLPVRVVRVCFNEAKGWHGGTDIDGNAEHLTSIDQIAILAAGFTAEKIFKCPAHEGAANDDHARIALILLAEGIPGEDHWPRVIEAGKCASERLNLHKDKFLGLVGRLSESGYVEWLEFQRLMHSD